MKALIVDDEPGIREELSEFVEDLGIEVETAANGEEALTKFYADPDIAIVLSDLMMPGLNGLDMLDNINTERQGKARVKQVIFHDGQWQYAVCHSGNAPRAQRSFCSNR